MLGIRALVVLIFLSASISGYGGYEVSGTIRANSCEEYTKETETKGKFTIYRFWFTGYITAFNQILGSGGLFLSDEINSVLPEGGADEMVRWVNEYCKNHPTTLFMKVAKEAGEFFLNQKIQKLKTNKLKKGEIKLLDNQGKFK